MDNFTVNRNGPPKSKTLRDQAPTVIPSNAQIPILGESGDTKYDLSLRIKNKVSAYKDALPRCPTLQAWDKQNEFKFGFIPPGSLKYLIRYAQLNLLKAHLSFTK